MHHHIPVSLISTAEGVLDCRVCDRLQVRLVQPKVETVLSYCHIVYIYNSVTRVQRLPVTLSFNIASYRLNRSHVCWNYTGSILMKIKAVFLPLINRTRASPTD